MITAAIAQRNRDVILWQESCGGGTRAWKPDSTPRDGMNDISTFSSSNEGRVENNCP